MTTEAGASYELAMRIARLESQARSRAPQLAYTALEAGAITEFDSLGNVVAAYGQQHDGSHMAMSYVGITPLKPTPAVIVPGPGQLEVEWLGTWENNGIVPSDFTRLEVHASADPAYLADESTTLYDTIETPRGAVVLLRMPAGVPMYIRFVARNLAGQRGPASDPVVGAAEAIMDQATIDQIQADIDAIPADIAASKQEAIDAAALTAQQKADLAEAEAIAAAATDASTKANAAQSAAIASAATTAQQKADAAQAAAISAAALDATQKANIAEADALAGSIPRTAGAVTETYIGTDAVSAVKILAGSVTTVKLDALAVTAAKIAAGAVVAGKIAADAVTSSTILAGAITAGKLAAASVIAGNIAADAVTATTIVAGAISSTKLATDSVTADKIAAGAVVAGKLAADSVVASNIKAGSISTEHLAIADTGNMAAINETYVVNLGGTGYTHVIETDVGGLTWSKRNAVGGSAFRFRPTAGPLDLKAGDRIRITFRGWSDVSFTPRMGIFYYLPSGASSGSQSIFVTGANTTMDATARDFEFEATLGSSLGGDETLYYIALLDVPATADPRVKGVRAYRMGAGELIVDGTIFASHLATDSVTAIKILAGAVTTGKLAALAVTADKIAANAILADKVDAGAITAGKLAAGAVIAGNIAANAVTASTISADAINGKTITGATVQTALSGSRMVIGPDPIDITAPGRLEWWDDHTTTPPEDLPPGIWGGLANKGNTQEQYSLGLSSGRTVGAGDAVLWMRARSRQVGAKSQVDLSAEVINFNGLGQVVTIAGDLSVNGKGIVVSSMQPSYATGGTFTSTGGGLSLSTQGASFVFVAPASGRVVVTTQGYLRVATAGQSAQLGFEIREGGVERSGTLIVGTDITRTVANYNPQYIGGSRSAVVSGLTPGATYNCYQTFNSSAANAVYTGISLLLEHSV